MTRSWEAAQKRQHRAELQQLRALERRAKEDAKLSALEQARLEVATYEGQVAALLSVHKEQADPWDWQAIAASLPPLVPKRQRHNELRGQQNDAMASAKFPSFATPESYSGAQDGRVKDDEDHAEALRRYEIDFAGWGERRALARRILAGEVSAFSEALQLLNPFADTADLCAVGQCIVHTARLVECALKVKGTEIIPRETKTLTSTGKLSVKPMPKGRYHEVFQDYVCSCVLRAGRDLFAVLPFETVLVTALVPTLDRPVLSIVIPRTVLSGLDWISIDPSDAMDSFVHRGDVKASRKTGEFVAVAPIIVGDVEEQRYGDPGLADVLATARQLRETLAKRNAELVPAGQPTGGG